ncbi:hypothetical protein N825_26915 [Skermanella stibiiresistens SB22]|uniref:DUF4112 domain-containing protein n=1 Tax=Skermanella stibiiresistens SB22 TaxID=1385369 RepID=W9GRR3_9PROT|nr:DUF4112 domain-containing protein [Skermanella stibiiresistens]EWY36469.1 hypothetical protein N825_26915 [Skermanella stibiiresistens SB22]
MAPRTARVHDYEAELARLQKLADLLDSRWRIPGTSIPIGLDGIASIVPVIGDSATGVVAAYLVAQAARLGVPRSILLRMAGNVGLDWAVGSIPVLGTLFDIGFKANRRNMRLLREHLEREHGSTARPTLRRV